MKLLFSLWLLLLATLVGVSIQQCALEDLNVIDLVLNTESNEFTDSPNMYINAIYYNCFSASQTIGLFTSTSLSVLYNKSDSAVLKEVRYNLQCMNGYWERVGRTSTALQNNDTRTDCYSCKDQTVNENHCSGKQLLGIFLNFLHSKLSTAIKLLGHTKLHLQGAQS